MTEYEASVLRKESIIRVKETGERRRVLRVVKRPGKAEWLIYTAPHCESYIGPGIHYTSDQIEPV